MDREEELGETEGGEDARKLKGTPTASEVRIIGGILQGARQAQNRDLYSRGYVRGFDGAD